MQAFVIVKCTLKFRYAEQFSTYLALPWFATAAALAAISSALPR